ncbi:MAG TPA: aconitate hydratase, partial [Dongiaceae bacterium]|nr:aconitate hydratase [Dongiaceae bacterium]
QGTPTVIFGGEEYGTGSSRDWAAKGTQLLGIKAVVARSFERIHRSNLVGMGVLPLQFKGDMTRHTLKLDGSEVFDIVGLAAGLKPRMDVTVRIVRPSGTQEIQVVCRIDTLDEIEYFKNGGILPFVLRNLMKAA